LSAKSVDHPARFGEPICVERAYLLGEWKRILMLQQPRTEVLVAGAGPVGMLTALLLSKAGIRVKIVDLEGRTASRTYACALHPQVLDLMDQLGLYDDILAASHAVKTVAFYEGETRRAEAALGKLPARHPFMLVLPQSTFENLLEKRLKNEANVHVQWNHQLSGLRTEGNAAVAVIDELKMSAKGYAVPEMDWSVEKTQEWHADYVVGADGPNAFTAKSLAFGYDLAGEPEFYAVFEFQSNWECPDELRIVVDKGMKSVLWPVAGRRFRWSFQLREEHLKDFPSKERNAVLLGQPAIDEANRDFMLNLIRARAPWFKGSIDELGWSTDVEFHHRVSKRFGVGRCWLVGDAAHQTGPAGMQSMNLGLLEAEQLAGALAKVLRDNASVGLLEQYNQTSREQWRQILGMTGPLKARSGVNPWVKEHRSDILSCLPASGDHLKTLLDQLQLDLPSANG
jgi:2-polyprenyl-6-methoxyphenol hydroxylase-like FAD-dependent oxidoreductase